MDENLRELDKNRDTKKIFVRFLKIFVQAKEDNYFLLRGCVTQHTRKKAGSLALSAFLRKFAHQ
jgi:hypothetical protein